MSMRKIQLSCLANKIKYLLFFGKLRMSFWDSTARVAAQRKRGCHTAFCSHCNVQLLCWQDSPPLSMYLRRVWCLPAES